MKTEYNIKGIFVQPFNRNGIFEGTDLVYDEISNSLVGKLIDVYGKSSVKGHLDLFKGVMNFDKTYDGVETIQYKLRKHQNLWLGEYFFKDVFGGEAICEIYNPKKQSSQFDWDYSANNARISLVGIDKWTQGLIKRMTDKELIKITTDATTGEKLIGLTNKGKEFVPKEYKI